MGEMAFSELTKEIENNVYDSFTVIDCVKIMKFKLQGSQEKPYSLPYMKRKLQDFFKENITFCNQPGRADVVMLYSNASKILSDFHSDRKRSDHLEEKRRIVQAAAKLVRSDIKSIEIDNEFYPDVNSLDNVNSQRDCLPESLTLFLRTIISGKKKEVKAASLGQAIAQAARPRSALFPIQFGVAVHVHRSFGSRSLVDTLSKLGFCSSYQQVRQFEASAAIHHGALRDQGNLTQPLEGQVQFVADNVDHNIRTLAGHGTFHGMGIMAVMTPPRLAHRRIAKRPIDAAEGKELGRIRISFYRCSVHNL
ncbi:hypothetical protein ElyMa_000790200 [Elysia marginata]|uniref:Uncharacterized protein n=1 Tax=Elysia marginata TaxID=1093978 RepID=A0AAV4GX86_9GAST|nr:hypothetical protein ElyMa_000790200 [Elysia marginata]